jgi:hypothetical protein
MLGSPVAARAMGGIRTLIDTAAKASQTSKTPSGPSSQNKLGMNGITAFTESHVKSAADSGAPAADSKTPAADSGTPRRAALPRHNPFNPFLNMGGMGTHLNNPFHNMGDMGTHKNTFLSQLAGQLGSTALHTAGQFVPPGPLSTAMHMAADMAGSSGLGGGYPVTQMAMMQNNFLHDQQVLADMNSANTMAASLIQQKQALTSALASVANKGASNIADAAKGQ